MNRAELVDKALMRAEYHRLINCGVMQEIQEQAYMINIDTLKSMQRWTRRQFLDWLRDPNDYYRA